MRNLPGINFLTYYDLRMPMMWNRKFFKISVENEHSLRVANDEGIKKPAETRVFAGHILTIWETAD